MDGTPKNIGASTPSRATHAYTRNCLLSIWRGVAASVEGKKNEEKRKAKGGVGDGARVKFSHGFRIFRLTDGSGLFVMYDESGYMKFPFSYLKQVTLLTLAQARLSTSSGSTQAGSPLLTLITIFGRLRRSLPNHFNSS